jgi:hypothetical protein
MNKLIVEEEIDICIVYRTGSDVVTAHFGMQTIDIISTAGGN